MRDEPAIERGLKCAFRKKLAEKSRFAPRFSAGFGFGYMEAETTRDAAGGVLGKGH